MSLLFYYDPGSFFLGVFERAGIFEYILPILDELLRSKGLMVVKDDDLKVSYIKAIFYSTNKKLNDV